MISGASIDRCERILLTTFYHTHHYTVQLLGRWSSVHNTVNSDNHIILRKVGGGGGGGGGGGLTYKLVVKY